MGLWARVRDSLESPQLIGESGYRRRYLKLQWWIVLWRLLILAQIPLVALIKPDRFGIALWYAFLVMALALAYTFIHYWLVTRTTLGTVRLHVADLLACALLMLASGDDKLLFVTMFFSFSSLLARPTTLIREALPATIFLVLAYLGAIIRIGVMPWTLYSSPERLGDLALFFFWGIGFVGFSVVMERASALELDSYLEEQRRDYRRQLHDDLGNTLCGLHFKIQSLARAGRDDLNAAIAFLTEGYERANGVLERLLAGIDEQVSGTLNESLSKMVNSISIKDEGGIEVELSLPARQVSLSPEMHREIYSIVREAVTNAAKHSGADDDVCLDHDPAFPAAPSSRRALRVGAAAHHDIFDTCDLIRTGGRVRSGPRKPAAPGYRQGAGPPARAPFGRDPPAAPFAGARPG